MEKAAFLRVAVACKNYSCKHMGGSTSADASSPLPLMIAFCNKQHGIRFSKMNIMLTITVA